MGRVGAAVELCTPWKRWFAWYPVTDLNVTYWLCWIELPDGMVPTRLPFRIARRIEYRR
jgi:hypothetical protein